MSTREVPGAAIVAPSRAHDGSIMETYTVVAHVASLTDSEARGMLATVPASAIGSPLHLALVERVAAILYFSTSSGTASSAIAYAAWQDARKQAGTVTS